MVKYINESRELGLNVLAPDINHSGLNFTPEGMEKIRFGLRAVKNVGENAILAILEARKDAGTFNSIYQFCEKTDLRQMNKRVVESLIKAGALDSLRPGQGQACRAALTAAGDGAFDSGTRAQRDRQAGQGGLFGGMFATTQPTEERLPNVAEWSETDPSAGEKETIGFYLSGHPLQVYLEKMQAICSADSSTLEGRSQGDEVTLGGLVNSMRTARSRRGETWAQVRLEDTNGFIELLVFPEAYKRLADRIVVDTAVFVRGRVNPDETGPPKINVTDIVPLEGVPMPKLAENIMVRVRLGRNGTAEKLAELFQSKPGDARVRLELIEEDGRRLNLDPPSTVRPDRDFLESLERICGKGCYQLIG